MAQMSAFIQQDSCHQESMNFCWWLTTAKTLWPATEALSITATCSVYVLGISELPLILIGYLLVDHANTTENLMAMDTASTSYVSILGLLNLIE